jgi:cyclopropane fatty-acyl-phospholipid synthase-like methyltransferase
MNWHSAMYDEEFANQSINAVRFHELAIKEVNFLTSYLQLRPGMKLLDVSLWGRSPCQVFCSERDDGDSFGH